MKLLAVITLKSKQGFTLIETLIALCLASAVLLPTSLWFYRSHASRAAYEKFQATQELERSMQRTFLLGLEQDWKDEVLLPGLPLPYRLEIRVLAKNGEIRYLGSAKNHEGVICHLEVDRFTGEAQ